MSIVPDSNWLNALKLPTQVMLGVFIACIIILSFNHYKVIQLSQFGDVAKPMIILIAIFTGSLSFTGVVSFIKDSVTKVRKKKLVEQRKKLQAEEKKEQQAKYKNSVLKRLDHLTPEELEYLADCLNENCQSFYTYVHSHSVGALIGKELVLSGGGTHNQDHYPFTITDFVWDELLERKDEFLQKHQDNVKKEEEKQKSRRYR